MRLAYGVLNGPSLKGTRSTATIARVIIKLFMFYLRSHITTGCFVRQNAISSVVPEATHVVVDRIHWTRGRRWRATLKLVKAQGVKSSAVDGHVAGASVVANAAAMPMVVDTGLPTPALM